MLIEFISILIKNYINNINRKEFDLHSFLLYIFTIFYCIKDKNKLIISEQFFKVQKGELINLLINDCFNLNYDNDTDQSLKNTFEFFIKLSILKISKNFYELNNDSDNQNQSVNFKFNLIYNISFLINFYFSLTQSKESFGNLSDSDNDDYMEELNHVVKNNTQKLFDLKELIDNIKLLVVGNNFIFHVEHLEITENFAKFFEMLKKELGKHLKFDTNILNSLELIKNLVDLFSKECNFDNPEINNFLYTFTNAKIENQNIFLNLFNILYLDYFVESIRLNLTVAIQSILFENFTIIKDSLSNITLKNGLNFEGIFLFLHTNTKVSSIFVPYTTIIINTVTDIIINFLDSVHSQFNNFNTIENKSIIYEYLDYLINVVFNNKIEIYLRQLEKVIVIDKLNLIKNLFTNIKKFQIEDEIFSSSISMLKMVNIVIK